MESKSSKSQCLKFLGTLVDSPQHTLNQSNMNHSFIPFLNQRDSVGRLKNFNKIPQSPSKIKKRKLSLVQVSTQSPENNLSKSNHFLYDQDSQINNQHLGNLRKSLKNLQKSFFQKHQPHLQIYSKRKSPDKNHSPIKSVNFEERQRHRLSLPHLKGNQKSQTSNYLSPGYYDYSDKIQQYKFKRSPQTKIYNSVKKTHQNQQNIVSEEIIKIQKKKIIKNDNQQQNYKQRLKKLRQLKFQEDPQIKRLLRNSKLSIKIIQDFDKNFQIRIKDAMMNALKVKLMIYKQ